MEIYGLGLIGICMFLGSFIGNLLGRFMGLNKDIGGVGFGMVFLIIITNYLKFRGYPISDRANRGITLISALYIPIVVAMSATQDVVKAFSGGISAIVIGGVTTILCLLLIPMISKIGNKD